MAPAIPARVLLGVTGGIAAYKAAELTSLLVKRGHEVRVILTKNACHFIGPLTFSALTGYPAMTGEELFDPGREATIGHIDLARWAQVVAVAPATADFLAKAAHGLADDLLSTTLLATTAPILLAPAMNPMMWQNPATQHNAAVLRERGVTLAGPAAGRTACGEDGPGRMLEPLDLAEALESLSLARDLAGIKVLVTAGPTREHLDPVRFISNPSTGRMGLEIARAARDRGAEVSVVLGPTHLEAPSGVECLRVTSAGEMEEAVMSRAGESRVIIKAAAVSDFKPVECRTHKVKKNEPGQEVCRLAGTTDILARLGREKTHQILVGFAAETREVLEHARQKLEKKNLDLLVANDVSAADSGFGVTTNRVHILHRDGRVESLPLLTKNQVAHELLDRVAVLVHPALEKA